ncbi:hypothetical protein TRAPUB_10763 [Trametes pubescens]|uniref:Uncharacterized protein n=1 Tax=Trametes pubescens TaxID=154538 RepID=A0A1M2VYV5_TRAPU|nr:hypothetical protein TRAPUB_10763 [Trametes pubescens]
MAAVAVEDFAEMYGEWRKYSRVACEPCVAAGLALQCAPAKSRTYKCNHCVKVRSGGSGVPCTWHVAISKYKLKNGKVVGGTPYGWWVKMMKTALKEERRKEARRRRVTSGGGQQDPGSDEEDLGESSGNPSDGEGGDDNDSSTRAPSPAAHADEGASARYADRAGEDASSPRRGPEREEDGDGNAPAEPRPEHEPANGDHGNAPASDHSPNGGGGEEDEDPYESGADTNTEPVQYRGNPVIMPTSEAGKKIRLADLKQELWQQAGHLPYLCSAAEASSRALVDLMEGPRMELMEYHRARARARVNVHVIELQRKYQKGQGDSTWRKRPASGQREGVQKRARGESGGNRAPAQGQASGSTGAGPSGTRASDDRPMGASSAAGSN